jgi:hypothetical protein
VFVLSEGLPYTKPRAASAFGGRCRRARRAPRGAAAPLSFTDALLAGLARDGGLYLPESWPTLSPVLSEGLPYTKPRAASAFGGRCRRARRAPRGGPTVSVVRLMAVP